MKSSALANPAMNTAERRFLWGYKHTASIPEATARGEHASEHSTVFVRQAAENGRLRLPATGLSRLIRERPAGRNYG